MKLKQSFTRTWWTLQRFGLSPGKVWYRAFNETAPKILCISIPKSGTHLLERALCLHPRLYRKLLPTVNDSNIHKWDNFTALLDTLHPGQVIVAHSRFTPERLQAIKARNIQCLFLIRDPRDIVVSQTFYILRNCKHPHYQAFLPQTNFKDRVKIAIAGHPPSGLTSIGQGLALYAGWLDSGYPVVRFEELIGPQGGGDQTKQLSALRAIYNSIIDIDDDWILSLSKQLFSSASPTFRKGAIGQWKQYFDVEMKNLFKKDAGKGLIQYGYEENDQW